MALEPITPDEVLERYAPKLDERSIHAFNQLIVDNFDPETKQARIHHDQAAVKLSAAFGTPADKIHERGHMDVKEAFEAKGWSVTYEGQDEDGCPESILFSVLIPEEE